MHVRACVRVLCGHMLSHSPKQHSRYHATMSAATTHLAPRALLLAVLCGAVTVATASTDMLWLPLGDSITWGCGTDAAPRGSAGCVPDAGGYRVPLAWALSQAGYNVTTMGTLKTGPSYVPEQWISHEGHPGVSPCEAGRH